MSAVSGLKFTILWRHVDKILLFNKFFPIVNKCLSWQPDKVVQWCADGNFLHSFWHPVFLASSVQHISDIHSKFALRPHHMWTYVDLSNLRPLNIMACPLVRMQDHNQKLGKHWNGQTRRNEWQLIILKIMFYGCRLSTADLMDIDFLSILWM